MESGQGRCGPGTSTPPGQGQLWTWPPTASQPPQRCTDLEQVHDGGGAVAVHGPHRPERGVLGDTIAQTAQAGSVVGAVSVAVAGVVVAKGCGGRERCGLGPRLAGDTAASRSLLDSVSPFFRTVQAIDFLYSPTNSTHSSPPLQTAAPRGHGPHAHRQEMNPGKRT